MDIEKNKFNSENEISPHAKNPAPSQKKKSDKQRKKELLATALRDNLRRRKSAATDNYGE